MKARTFRNSLAVLLAAALLLGLCAYSVSADYDLSGATSFVFSDSGIAVTEGSADGYSISGTDLTIQGAGTYVISGSCADGTVTVKKGTTGVTLVLNGLTLHSADSAPLVCGKSSEVRLVAAAGSENTLSDSERNNDEEYPDNENAENAVIKAKDGAKLTLCGSGSLTVIAAGKNGVKGGASTEEEGEASLTVEELTLTITAREDGLKSDQELNILSGTVTVSAGDDGIKSEYVLNIGAEGTDGPTVLVAESEEGIEAATLNICSGSVTVHAEEDGINAANGDLSGYAFSCTISGGQVYVDARTGDGIDSNGSLSITGGSVEVWSASSGDNSPLDAETSLSLSGGTVLAVGAQGMGVRFSGETQPYLIFGGGGFGRPGGFGGQQTGGGLSLSATSTLSILDADGNSLYTATAQRAASYVIFSSEALNEGETYTLSVNGSAAASATASAQSGSGTPGDGQMPGTPGDGQMPGTPGDGQMPGMPGDGQMPGMPGDGQMPGMPGDGQTPGRPEDGQMPGDGQMPERPAGRYRDVAPDAWYRSAVDGATERGLMQGTGEDSFSPQLSATRAMAAVILYRLAGSPEVEYSEAFSDVPQGKWYTDAVIWAFQEGILLGYPDGSFYPTAALTRESLITILFRYADRNGEAEASGDLSAFTDADSASGWARSALRWAVAARILQGDGDGNLNPRNETTRAELAQILMNWLD